jgi:hypothetical protein
MRDTVARALCRENCDEPCKFCTVEAGLAVVALAEAGYLRHLKTDDGAPKSGEARRIIANALSAVAEERTGEASPLDYDGARAVLNSLGRAGFVVRKTDDGAGASPAASAVPLDPAAQAGETIGSPAPSSPRESTLPLDVMSRAFVRSEFGSYGGGTKMLRRAGEGYRLAGIAFGALKEAGYILTKTDDGAGSLAESPSRRGAQAGSIPASDTAPSSPRLFELVRKRDVSGVTGTGVVADGVRWTDSTVTLRWKGDHPATAVWDSVDSILAVHGHEGATVVRWLDGEPA